MLPCRVLGSAIQSANWLASLTALVGKIWEGHWGYLDIFYWLRFLKHENNRVYYEETAGENVVWGLTTF